MYQNEIIDINFNYESEGYVLYRQPLICFSSKPFYFNNNVNWTKLTKEDNETNS